MIARGLHNAHAALYRAVQRCSSRRRLSHDEALLNRIRALLLRDASVARLRVLNHENVLVKFSPYRVKLRTPTIVFLDGGLCGVCILIKNGSCTKRTSKAVQREPALLQRPQAAEEFLEAHCEPCCCLRSGRSWSHQAECWLSRCGVAARGWTAAFESGGQGEASQL